MICRYKLAFLFLIIATISWAQNDSVKTIKLNYREKFSEKEGVILFEKDSFVVLCNKVVLATYINSGKDPWQLNGAFKRCLATGNRKLYKSASAEEKRLLEQYAANRVIEGHSPLVNTKRHRLIYELSKKKYSDVGTEGSLYFYGKVCLFKIVEIVF